MKYLFLKFGRDIKKLWPQFFSVFIMAMISMTIFAGMGCVWKGMQVSSNEYFDDTNLADAWVTCDQVTEDDLNHWLKAEAKCTKKAVKIRMAFGSMKITQMQMK